MTITIYGIIIIITCPPPNSLTTVIITHSGIKLFNHLAKCPKWICTILK